jgi:hypothetical protein
MPVLEVGDPELVDLVPDPEICKAEDVLDADDTEERALPELADDPDNWEEPLVLVECRKKNNRKYLELPDTSMELIVMKRVDADRTMLVVTGGTTLTTYYLVMQQI